MKMKHKQQMPHIIWFPVESNAYEFFSLIKSKQNYYNVKSN